jgi:hypothetical protein
MANPIKNLNKSLREEIILYQMPLLKLFNDCIIERWNDRSATIRQDYVVDKIKKKIEIDYREIFDMYYLDVEEIFRDAGWIVTYDKPGYNETYPATFEFKKQN